MLGAEDFKAKPSRHRYSTISLAWPLRARRNAAAGGGGLSRRSTKRRCSSTDRRMNWASSIARCAASCAAVTLRPCSSTARRTTASAFGAIRASRRALRVVFGDILESHFQIRKYVNFPYKSIRRRMFSVYRAMSPQCCKESRVLWSLHFQYYAPSTTPPRLSFSYNTNHRHAVSVVPQSCTAEYRKPIRFPF